MRYTHALTWTCLAFCTTMYGQTGINTIEPKEALHVGGASAKIRVDGLNSTNNANNHGGNDLYNLMVDDKGNFALGLQSGLVYSDTKLSAPVPVLTTASAGLAEAELYQHNFTLTQRALVVVTYNVEIAFRSYDGLSSLADGRAKIAHNYFYLGDGTTADATKAYGMSSSVYANYVGNAADDAVLNSQTQILTLDPGTYSIHMYGASYGGGITAGAAFRSIFGNGDRLDISAIYL